MCFTFMTSVFNVSWRADRGKEGRERLIDRFKYYYSLYIGISKRRETSRKFGNRELLVESDLECLGDGLEMEGDDIGVVLKQNLVALLTLSGGEGGGIFLKDRFTFGIGGGVEIINLFAHGIPLVDKWLERFENGGEGLGLAGGGLRGGGRIVVGLDVGLLLVVGEGGKIFELLACEAGGEFGRAIGGIDDGGTVEVAISECRHLGGEV